MKDEQSRWNRFRERASEMTDLFMSDRLRFSAEYPDARLTLRGNDRAAVLEAVAEYLDPGRGFLVATTADGDAVLIQDFSR